MKYALLLVATLGLVACGESEEQATADSVKDNAMVKIATDAGSRAQQAVDKQNSKLPE